MSQDTSAEQDLLYGGPAICAFLNSLSEREFTLGHTYRLIAARRIPARKSGPKTIIAPKREIRASLPGGAAASA